MPISVLCSVIFFNGQKADLFSYFGAFLSIGVFFLKYENNRINVKETVIISVMIALSVGGRMLFAWLPAFKPVTALVIVAGVYLGAEAGFLTGSLTALISNFYFGQGSWTPFQMLVWGYIGFFAGVLAKIIVKNKITLVITGVLSGVAFSLLMDVWTVYWVYKSFSPELYLLTILSSAEFTAIYAVSNVIFLLILLKPIGKKLERVKIKYGIA